MLTYDLPSTKICRVGRSQNDDGSSADPWALPDWRFAPFESRFADPEKNAQYRIRYVALTAYGAYVESLQHFRPDLALLKELAEITDAGEPVLGPAIPVVYFQKYALARAELVIPGDQGLFDLVTGKGMARAHPAIQAAARQSGHKLSDYDASTLLSATPRAFTQALSRVVFEYNDFNGIAYCSRFDPSAICVALFEGVHDVRDAEYDAIDQASQEFRKACAVHHLPIHAPKDAGP
jgi:RES domain-containing protein